MQTFDELRQRLIDGGLLAAVAVEAQVQAWMEETGASQSGAPQHFLDWLVQKELITAFHAEAIAAGITGPFMLGPYRVYEHLIAGRHGGVFRAVHEEFNQPVSLKVFAVSESADPERVARISRELRVAVELDHPNVIRSFQLGKIGETYFLAMEDLKGQTLEQKLEKVDALPYKTACKVAQQLANGLAHLHDNDVVHRDVRPANVWIAEGGTAKLMEFGAARDAYAFLDSAGDGMGVTTSESVLGEYDYMAPEQAKDPRDADERSDVYALGCTLYHAVSGRVPFEEKNPARLVLRHAADMPEPVSSLVAGVPHQLDDTLAAIMAKDPDDRYQSAADVAYALDPFVESQSSAEAPGIGPVVSGEYLEWARSTMPAAATSMPEEAVAVTPELMQFLDWLSTRKVRRRRRR